mmetsp:Transcript_27431/g.38268  ORF Transcript_27431/g.38268 Transcript_27431/m.38268 type:complete len:264 (+) Transcript_27431:42-833(+)|eukprot:CAMPEP_0185270960 /NCGR_PEP_ID=MMETSP1359-20130426/43582_1 /TAXON_ID=552665 /ORGANISM="Bigelowiella longifila, Strain CCMP242" /LENGTH=263 /DNA_ID=CAMNT_0027862733 /DNA_START=22 /DNA_END=813 /DNA_ORIENTATION=+
MEQIRDYAVSLITKKCYVDMFESFIFEKECIEIFMSKALGLAIVMGSAIMKLPQIIAILPGDTTGLSLPTFAIESVNFSIIVMYNYLQGYPVSTWGENFFLLLQNYVIILLILIYRKQLFSLWTIGGLLLYGTGIWMVSSGFLEALKPLELQIRSEGSAIFTVVLAGPGALESILALCTNVMAPFSRVLQIHKNWSEGSTGQLSLPTTFLAAAGSVVRGLTILKEVPDPILLRAVALSVVLNTTVLAQIIFYRFISTGKVKKD